MTQERMTGPSRKEVTGRERGGVAGNVVGLLARRKHDQILTLSPPVVEEPVVSVPETAEETIPDVVDVVATRELNSRQSQAKKDVERVREIMKDSDLHPL